MMIFFKITWKTRYIFWRCRLADYFIRFVVCNIKSVQEHKIVFFTDKFIKLQRYIFFLKHVNHPLIVLVVEFSIQRKRIHVLSQNHVNVDRKRSIKMVVFIEPPVRGLC